MKILTIHSDYIKFEPVKKAIKEAKEIEKIEKTVKECLVVFTSVEKQDEENIDGIVKKLINEIKNITAQIKVDKVVLYPYAHLSSNLASSSKAEEVLEKAENLLKKDYKEVIRAPFGWYKKFEISCKGHPLSEFSREFNADKIIEKKRKEESEFSKFFVIDEKGNCEEINDKNWENAKIWKDKKIRTNLLKNFVRNELVGNTAKDFPKHVELMKKLELYDYVPYSDVGNLRCYPNGMLIFDILKDYVLYQSALKLGCMKLQNPIMFDGTEPTIKELVGDFHEKDYRVISEKKEFILRYASDPLNFPMLNKINITYKQMPFGIYEEALSFRLEKRGETVGLKRLRAFNMLDIHVFTKTEEESTKKIEELCYNFQDMLKNLIGDKWVLGWEIVEDYWNKNKDYFINIVKNMECPTFIKIMPEMSHYYAFKNEYQAIGMDGANVQVSTLQLDIKDGKRFDISYLDSDGKKKPCFIIHTAPIGSLERCMYLVLENALYMEQEGKSPMLPLWLSPEQVRLISVSERHIDKCIELSEILEKENIRVGIDDRNEILSKKVFDAKTNWVPYIIVIGDREADKKEFPAVIREKSTLTKDYKEEMNCGSLIKEIKEKIKGLPFRPLYINKFVSRRINFVEWSQEKTKK